MTEINKEASETTKRLFAALREEFLRNLEGFYPCDLNSGATLAEGNLTSKFAITLRRDAQYKNALTWDEFSVPNELRTEKERRSRKPGNLDMVVIAHRQKEIAIVESKLLKFHPRKKTIGCKDLPSDFVRAINVIRSSEVFPKRIWDPRVQKKNVSAPIPLLREKYDCYSTKMIGLCGVWTGRGAATEKTVEDYFRESMRAALSADALSCYDIFDKSELIVEKLNAVFPVIQNREWDYYLLMFVADIDKGEIDYSSVPKTIVTVRPKKSRGATKVKRSSSVVRPRSLRRTLHRRPANPDVMRRIVGSALGIDPFDEERWKTGNSTNYRYCEPTDCKRGTVHVWFPNKSVDPDGSGNTIYCAVLGKANSEIPNAPEGWTKTAHLDWGKGFKNNWFYPIGGPESFNTEEGIKRLKANIKAAIDSLKESGLIG